MDLGLNLEFIKKIVYSKTGMSKALIENVILKYFYDASIHLYFLIKQDVFKSFLCAQKNMFPSILKRKEIYRAYFNSIFFPAM